jgi:hypothetical protein
MLKNRHLPVQLAPDLASLPVQLANLAPVCQLICSVWRQIQPDELVPTLFPTIA